MKLFHLLSLSCLLFVCGAARLSAQASAVDGMKTLNATATVNTAFIASASYLGQTVPSRSSGTYRYVYSCSVSTTGVVTQVGTSPNDWDFWGTYPNYYFATGKWYSVRAFQDGFFYIERYTENYNSSSGAYSWSRMVYRGPATVAPTATPLALSATRVWLGQSLTIAASASDADNDLWSLATVSANPQHPQTVYVGKTGKSFDTPSLSLNQALVLPAPGQWIMRLTVQDWAGKTPAGTPIGAANGVADIAWIDVLPGFFYDPSGGTAYPSIVPPEVTAPTGHQLVVKAGQPGLVPVTFKVAGMGAGKPVRVSLGAEGAALFASSAGGGAGALFLDLVTNANGEVTVWVRAGDRARTTTMVHALAGRGRHAVRLSFTAAEDVDDDGMSDAMETALSGSATGVAYNPAVPAITGFAAFGP